MCGRTACTLGPDEICQACSVRRTTKGGKGQYQAPEWRDHPGGKSYTTSFNIAPSRFTPVIISDHHVRGVKRQSDSEGQPPQRIIQPMMWGLIPPFYKGSSPTGHGLTTNNCRVEDIEEKKSYMPSLIKGQRCVVLCDGFYEWKAIKGEKNKQPYFVYAQQPDGIEIWNRESWDKPGVWSEDDGWRGPQLLKMAGLFSCWLSTEGEEVMSYTVLTMESGKKFSNLHHRVPAILQTDQDVADWLDFGRIGYKEALMNLKNDVELAWHPVSTAVNNSRNQAPNINVPVSLDKKPLETASSKLMSAWLSKGSFKKDRASLKEEKKDTIKVEAVEPYEDKEKKPSSLMNSLKKESDDTGSEK